MTFDAHPTKSNCYKVDPSVIDQFDHVFLFGDTNYRINAERPFVFDALKQGDYNVRNVYMYTWEKLVNSMMCTDFIGIRSTVRREKNRGLTLGFLSGTSYPVSSYIQT